VLAQTDATPDRLHADLKRLLSDPERLQAMGTNARKISRPAAAAHLADELLALAGRG
jgi:UDP-N-acetylglucosamine:LPS N-acetylglucosamine transferase